MPFGYCEKGKDWTKRLRPDERQHGGAGLHFGGADFERNIALEKV